MNKTFEAMKAQMDALKKQFEALSDLLDDAAAQMEELENTAVLDDGADDDDVEMAGAKAAVTGVDKRRHVHFMDDNDNQLVRKNIYVLRKGAKINPDDANTLLTSTVELRKKCRNSGQIDADNVLTTDMSFKTPSAASRFVTGTQTSGPQHWKLDGTHTLDDVENAEENVRTHL